MFSRKSFFALAAMAALVSGPALAQQTTVQGVYNSAVPTAVAGQPTPVQLDSKGSVKVVLADTSGNIAPVNSPAADASPISNGGFYTNSRGLLYNGSNWDMARSVQGQGSDGSSGTGVQIIGSMAFNGTTYDRVRTANGANGTTGAGLFGSGSMVFDGTNWQKQPGNASGIYNTPRAQVSSGVGLSTARIVTGTSGVIKASVGQLYHVIGQSSFTAPMAINFYDKATAPTLGTDVPVLTLTTGANDWPMDYDLSIFGVNFVNGIAWSYTTDFANAPATAGTSGNLKISVLYK